ncbi:MAG: hypothetical protein HOZ81_48205 [Streptomyces sp.]|nr:hypothetical protein [Streptomyces sp.]NUP38189.1 hypothetical protein [Streptomyces sp.]
MTGLVVVDTATHWSACGEWVIAGLIQVGDVEHAHDGRELPAGAGQPAAQI